MVVTINFYVKNLDKRCVACRMGLITVIITWTAERTLLTGRRAPCWRPASRDLGSRPWPNSGRLLDPARSNVHVWMFLYYNRYWWHSTSILRRFQHLSNQEMTEQHVNPRFTGGGGGLSFLSFRAPPLVFLKHLLNQCRYHHQTCSTLSPNKFTYCVKILKSRVS